MTAITTLVGRVVHGLSVAGNHPLVAVEFTASFTCTPSAPVTTPLGMSVTGGLIKGVAKYDAPSTSGFANSCANFNGPDLMAISKVNIHWTHTPATPAIQPTKIVYHNLGANTVGGGVITLAGSATQVTKVGSFAVPNPPNTVQLVTNLFPNSPCPNVTPPFTPFTISGGTIHV